MFNRYVDGLGTTAPDDPAVYTARARQFVATGYVAWQQNNAMQADDSS